MSYNVSELYNATSISDLTLYANNATDGVLFGFFMIGIFLVMMFALKRWEFDDSLLASSFACFILSGILSYGGYLNMIFPLGFLAMMAFTAFYIFVVKRT